jgi:hypothetical protein
MTKLATAVALIVLAASPAFAQITRHQVSMHARTSNVVIEDGQYIGRDPDANIRAELRRDYGTYLGA